MSEITSTEKLLDLIRKKKGALPPSALKLKTSPSGGRKRMRLSLPARRTAGKSIHVGVDIGHDSLRMVKTVRISDTRWDLIDQKTLAFPPQVRPRTPDFSEFLKTELKQFCGAYRKIQIWAIMPAANVNVRHLRIPKVPKNQIENTVFWVLKKETPFNEKETLLDFDVLEEVLDQGAPKWLVMAYTAPIAEIEVLKSLFSKIGMPLTGISTVPFAVQNLLRTCWIQESDDAIANLFIGNDFSRIDFYSKGKLVMTRGIKAGINSMIEALQEALAPPDPRNTLSEGEEPPPEISLAQARKCLFSLIPGARTLTEGDPGYDLTEEQKFQAVLPALDRIIRQVERTLEQYNKPVSRIFVTSALGVYPPLIRHVGEEIDLESGPLDPFEPGQTCFDPAAGNGTIDERIALTPALGMALSDNAYTPNLLFTAGDERQLDRISWFNRGIIAALVVATVITAGFFFYQLGIVNNKNGELDRLKMEMSRYRPRLTQTDLLQMAARAKQQKYSPRIYSERYRGMAVIGELSALTPIHIQLMNLKADFGAAAAEKAGATPKEAPKEKTAPAGGEAGQLTVEGVILGNPRSLELSLAEYVMRLQDSPIFRQVSLQRNSVERVGKRDVLKFTINLKVL